MIEAILYFFVFIFVLFYIGVTELPFIKRNRRGLLLAIYPVYIVGYTVIHVAMDCLSGAVDYNEALKPLWILVFPILAIIAFTLSVIAVSLIKSLWEGLVKFLARLRLKLPAKTYHPIHNVTLPTPRGTMQIDHIFVSQFGIFIVETNNMKGRIFGDENRAQWIQKISKKPFKFRNPLRQNYKHVKALEAALNVPPGIIHSVVVFANESTFKSPMPANITQGRGYITYIKSFNEPVLNESQVQCVVSKIQTGRLEPTRETHCQHVQQLKMRVDPFSERN